MAACIVIAALGLQPLASAQTCGDCDGNGLISVLDALRIAQINVGILDAPAPCVAEFNACNPNGALCPSASARIDILDALVVAVHATGATAAPTCGVAVAAEVSALFLGAPALLPSTANAPASEIVAIDFRLADSGVDGFDAVITGIVIRAGPGDQIPDWRDAFGGARLLQGGAEVAAGVIGVDSFDFAIGGLTIPDGGQLDLDLAIWLSDAPGALDGLDGSRLALAIAPDDLSTSGAGSAADPAAPLLATPGGTLVIDIAATRLSWKVEPRAVTAIGANLAPVMVAATDASENVDLDAIGTITLSHGGAGTLASTDAGGLTHAMSGGVASWSNLSISAETSTRLVATSAPAMLSGASRQIAITSMPRITSVFPDRGRAAGGEFVTIEGVGLDATAAVAFAGRIAETILAISPAMIVVRTPPPDPATVGAPITVSVGALIAPAAYTYVASAKGPEVITTQPPAAAPAIAPGQRFAFLLDAAILPASLQDPLAIGDSSTALIDSGMPRAGQAYSSEDGRWIVLRRMGSSWPAGARADAALFGEVAGVSAIADLQGLELIAPGAALGRAAFVVSTISAPAIVADTRAPVVIATSPTSMAVGVPRSAQIEIFFDEAIDASTARANAGGPVSRATVWVRREHDGASIACALALDASGRRVTLDLMEALERGAWHALVIEGAGASGGVEDLAGNRVASTEVRFRAAAASGLSVSAARPAMGSPLGGNPVRVTGEGFAPGAEVAFAAARAWPTRWISASELEVIAPPAAMSGAVDINITNPDGETVVGLGLYSYASTSITDSFAPELIAEFPPALASGTSPAARNARIVLVFSEALDQAAEAIGVGAGDSVDLDGGAGTVTRSASDPRIHVLARTLPYPAAPTIYLTPRVSTAPERGMRDIAGNRLAPSHPHRRFGISPAGDVALGLSWSNGGLDATAPMLVAATPAAGSSAQSERAPITITLNESFDPLSVESGLAITDAGGALPGALRFDLTTLRTFTFAPARAYFGMVMVDIGALTDLAGNPVGMAQWTFTTLGDASPPQITFLTVGGVPAHLNGGAASGGGSPGGGRLRVPPAGFTIDMTYLDVGGRVATAPADFVLTCDQAVMGHAPGINLIPFLPPGHFHADETGASVLVPPSLEFPHAVTPASGVPVNIQVGIRDENGNSSAMRSFGVDVSAARADMLPLDGGGEHIALEFFRDHEDTQASFATYSIPLPGADSCATPDGEIDFHEDLKMMGITSGPPEFVPGGEAQVDSGVTTINAAARAWMMRRIHFHLLSYFGKSADFADGNPNPGFAPTTPPAPLLPSALGDIGGAHAAAISFEIVTAPVGQSRTRIAFGGFKSVGVGGFAPLDPRNQMHADDIGESCVAPNFGVFSLVDAATEFGSVPSSPASPFRQLFDPIVAFTGGALPQPIGSSSHDAFALDPLADPTLFVGARRARYEVVLAALEGFARRQAYLAAHELGHALGLIANGDPGLGLYGNDPAFPGSTSAHLELRAYYPANARNLLSPLAPLEASRSRFSGFNELAFAYLLGQIVVGY